MSTGRPRGRILRFPSTEPWAPPRWQPIRVGLLPAAPAGLRELERLVVRFVRRGWRLLRALDEASGIDMETVDDGPVIAMLALDGSWIDLLCHIARHEVGPDDVAPLRDDLRRMGREQLLLRQAIYTDLAKGEGPLVAASEQAQRVTEREVRQAVTDMVLALDEDAEDDDDDPDYDTDFGGPPPLVGPSQARLAEVNALRRAEWERRPLPPSLGLRACLRSLPVEWLDGIGHTLNLDLDGRRRGREAAVARALLDGGRLTALVERLPGRSRAALESLLASDGWATAQTLTRNFGSDRADAWFWLEQPPPSALGRLRRCGLAYVGSIEVDGAPVRAVAVPPELRRLLRGG